MARKQKQSGSPLLRGRVWVEIRGLPALTESGADLLEQIAAIGSLSQAARRLGFSYRRAWMLVDAMNKRWPEPLVETTIGGKRGGGSQLTDLGEVVLRSYRDLQLQVEHLLDKATRPFERATKPHNSLAEDIQVISLRHIVSVEPLSPSR